MEDRIQLILQECLDLLAKGSSLEQCLAQYPQEAQELEPLLRAALTARSQLSPSMPPTVRAQVRSRVLDEWDRRHQPRRWGWPSSTFPLRWAAVATTIVMALFLSGGGIVVASGGAVPGDLLYPVKEAREAAQLWFARSPEAKVSTYSSLVHERAEELRELALSERPAHGPIDRGVERLHQHLTDLNELVEREVLRPVDGTAPADVKLLEELQEAISEGRAAEELLQSTLLQAPPAARPGLERALEAIQTARDRVRSAVEAVGPAVP